MLRRLGAEVRPVRLSSLQRYADCGRTIHFAESYAVHERDLQQHPEDYAPITRSKLLPGAFIPASDYVKAQQFRGVLCREFAALMKDYDAVITLSSLDLPCRIDDPETISKTYERQCRIPFNVTGTPAIAVPTGFTAAGLPLAMQIAGARLCRADGLPHRARLLRGDRIRRPPSGCCESRRSGARLSWFP